MADTFETEVDIAAPPEEVFRHLVEHDAMLAWMGQRGVLEPYPGGRFELDINEHPMRGTYLAVEPPRRVVVTWGWAGSDELPPGTSTVEFTLTATSEGTRLRLVHSDLPGSQVSQHGEGWQHFLPRLAVAATGGDPGPDTWADAG